VVGKEHPEVLSPVLTSLAELLALANFLYCAQVVGKEHPEVLSPVLTSLAELRVLADFLYCAQVVGKEHPEVLSPVLTSLSELRGSANFSLEGEVDHVVGRAVAAMGPARLLAAIPLNITGIELVVMLIVTTFSCSVCYTGSYLILTLERKNIVFYHVGYSNMSAVLRHLFSMAIGRCRDVFKRLLRSDAVDWSNLDKISMRTNCRELFSFFFERLQAVGELESFIPDPTLERSGSGP
jgi:hypothetical protein